MQTYASPLRTMPVTLSQSGRWTTGNYAGMSYSALVFSFPSRHGIEGGRISKLEIRNAAGIAVYNFDRGLDIAPADARTSLVLRYILRQFA